MINQWQHKRKFNTHTYTHSSCSADKSTVGKKGISVPLFLPTVFGEEKGSVEIKEGRVSSRAEHQRKTAESGDKL